MKNNKSEPIFPVSVAAKLVGLTPKMLRIYDQEGLLKPSRMPDSEKIRGRRLYSQDDIEKINMIRELITKGYNIKQLNDIADFIEYQKNRSFSGNKLGVLSVFYDFLNR